MSRSQENQTFNTAQSEQNTNFSNAQKSEKADQNAIGQYSSALAKYASSNPYLQGGEYQTAQNQSLSNTADAESKAAANEMAQRAARTGQNPAAATAAEEEIAQQGQRDLSGNEAKTNADRIGSEAKYNEGVVAGTGKLSDMQERLAALQQAGSNSDLAAQQAAAKGNPSFMDTLGTSFGSALGSGLGKLATGQVIPFKG